MAKDPLVDRPHLEVALPATESSGDYTRKRGVYSPLQKRGFELMPQVTMLDGGVAQIQVGNDVALITIERNECTCENFRRARPRTACSHIWAVRYYLDPPTPDEFVVPEQPATVPAAAPPVLATATSLSDIKDAFAAGEIVRGGYKRHARAYDTALRSEFARAIPFAKALFAEVESIFAWREQQARGRSLMPLAPLMLSAFIRTEFDWSYRRTEGFMEFLADTGVIHQYPDFNLASRFMRSPAATPLLQSVVALTAEPFRDIGGLRLAVDGTGFGSNCYFDYRCEARDRKEQARGNRISFHTHVISGVDTLHAVAVRVTESKKDSEKGILENELLPELVSRGYEVDEFFADGGYNSTMLREKILEMGAIPYIPWASNAKNAIPKPWRNAVKHSDILKTLFAMCMNDPEKFKQWYRYRVKIENLFSAVKSRYGGYVRSIHGNAPANEILMKFICHNIHMLLMASEVYGIDIDGAVAKAVA